ncbi:class I adenylate-forming enzyme family protein [Streptomyces sp. NPDC003710]
MLFETVRGIATGRSAAIAVETTLGERCTYGELLERTQRVAAGLTARGVRAGDTVLCCGIPNSPGYVVFILAVAAIRASYTPLLQDFDQTAIDRAFDLTKPVLWVGPTHRGSTGEPPIPRVELGDLEATAPNGSPTALGQADRIWRRLWTSGSTKLPKLVQWRQGPFTRERLRWVADLSITDRDVVFCRHTLDVAHATDLHVFASLLAGARLVLADPQAPASVLLRQLEEHRATLSSMLPNHYEDLVAAAASSGGADLSAMRRPLCGGSYVSPVLMRAAAETLGIHIRQVYGSTEFGLALGNMSDIVQSEAGMIPVRGVKARLAPLTEDAAPDLGTLVLVSDCTSEGYLDDDEANAVTFRGKEFWTGDVAQCRADGSYRILGRVSDVLASSTGPLPAPAFDALIADACAEVAGSVSLPAQTDAYAPDVLVVVEPAPEADAEAAIAAVKELAEQHGLNPVVRTVSAIPRTVVGKVDKPVIRRQWLSQDQTQRIDQPV